MAKIVRGALDRLGKRNNSAYRRARASVVGDAIDASRRAIRSSARPACVACSAFERYKRNSTRQMRRGWSQLTLHSQAAESRAMKLSAKLPLPVRIRRNRMPKSSPAKLKPSAFRRLARYSISASPARASGIAIAISSIMCPPVKPSPLIGDSSARMSRQPLMTSPGGKPQAINHSVISRHRRRQSAIL